MSVVVMTDTYGNQHPVDSSMVSTYSGYGWTVASNPDGSPAGVVDPSAPAEQQAFDNTIAQGNLSNNATDIANRNANTIYSNQTARNSTIAQDWLNARGPSNYAQYSNLMSGRTAGASNALGYWDALSGTGSGSFEYTPQIGNDLTPLQPSQLSTDGVSIQNPNNGPSSNGVHFARGGAEVVQHPQTIHVGEHGRPELVIVHPLANPGVGIDARTAATANALQPQLHVIARPPVGPIPLWARSLNPQTHAASGGVYGTGQYGAYGTQQTPQPIAQSNENNPDAWQRPVIQSGDQPWNNDGQYGYQQNPNAKAEMVNANGQVLAPDPYHPGSFHAIPQYQQASVLSPTNLDPQWAAKVLADPLLKQMTDSILAGQGWDPGNFWAQYESSKPQQLAPALSATRGF